TVTSRTRDVCTTKPTITTSKPLTTPNWHNTTAPPTYTSTFTTQTAYTVTSCPPYVTSCPIGSVTTETITGTVTWAPGQGNSTKEPAITADPTPSITSVFTTTKTHTITDCRGKGHCSKGHVTTEVLTSTTYLCPESTATWTIPRTHICGDGEHGCTAGQTITTTHVVTIVPITPGPEPTPVPGCSGCSMPPVVTTPAVQTSALPTTQVPSVPPVQTSALPTMQVQSVPPVQTLPINTIPGTISTVTRPTSSPCTTCGPATSIPPVLTAGAAEWRAPGVAALAMGVLAVVAM
ncbi:Secreted aspartic proteinase, partial [Tolypocladium paradoxum]